MKMYAREIQVNSITKDVHRRTLAEPRERGVRLFNDFWQWRIKIWLNWHLFPACKNWKFSSLFSLSSRRNKNFCMTSHVALDRWYKWLGSIWKGFGKEISFWWLSGEGYFQDFKFVLTHRTCNSGNLDNNEATDS